MSIIHKLPLAEAQKIAAGEVVERPFNIVKELIENALDAQATEIILYIEDGGKRRIQCIDNGVGMDEADARMCIEHHATSKLKSVHDLEHITTYGFRGEALSTISAIAQLTLATQQPHAPSGTQICVSYGTFVSQETIMRPAGTEIIVDNIFAHVPARKKFLKTRETEWRAIFTLIQALALAYPQVRFVVYHDHNLMLNTHPTDKLSERIAQLFDATLAEHIIPCDGKTDRVVLTGVITRHEYTRYDKQQQFFFVNKRWIKNYKLGQALMKGYSGVLPAGKFPAAIIFMEVPPVEVDINVHPRKEEVVFLYPRLIEQELTRAVHTQLAKLTAARVSRLLPDFAQSFVGQTTNSPHPAVALSGYGGQAVVSELEWVRPAELQYHTVAAPERTPLDPQGEARVIGQALQTYIILESPEGIVLIDQHAAHEAVLFEQFSQQKHEALRVRLLFPEIISATPHDQELLLAHADHLRACGIVLEQAGPQALMITESPVHLKNYNFKELLHDLLAWLGPGLTGETWALVSKKLFAMMACKAAVKAHDTLSHEKMQEIIQQLYATQHRQTCPHGRPTTWLLSKQELERKFKRAV